MSYAMEIETEERPATADAFAISDLWILPILLFALMFDRFSRHLTNLKQMRRRRQPFRTDWQSFYPEVRACEWAIHMSCFEGARQILLGEDLDLAAIRFDREPPEDFQPPMPRAALAMHQRLEDIARFHADPERYIRRHAERIRGRSGERGSERDCGRNSGPEGPVAGPLVAAVVVPVALAIRGPP